MAAVATRPLAHSAGKRLLNWAQQGELGRLSVELDARLGRDSGLTRTGLAPLLDDLDFVEALEDFSVTAVFPRDRILHVLARHLAPLHEGQSVEGAAHEVADAIESSMVFAKANDREALTFELRRLKAETFADAAPSLVEDEPSGDSRERRWSRALAAPYYLNVSRLLMDPAAGILPGALGWLEGLTSFREADGATVLRAMSLFDDVFSKWELKAVDVGSFEALEELPIGARISFSGHFRTKNLAGREPATIAICGELDEDPHVYLKSGGRKVSIPIDPRWITSMSALIEFSSGQALLGGLGVLRSLSEGRATVAAIALGLPLTEGNRWFYDP